MTKTPTGWIVADLTEPAPKHIRKFTLDLGGMTVSTDDQFSGRMVYVTLAREITRFDYDTPLETVASELPARLLPVLRAAVEQLEAMVNGPPATVEEVPHVQS
jgi:hypothetical protein